MSPKILLIFICISLVSSVAQSHERGCFYILGTCVRECEEGTHAYVSSCQAPTWSQKTCKNPKQTDMGAICDLSRCECDDPTVYDEVSKKCVHLADCPQH